MELDRPVPIKFRAYGIELIIGKVSVLKTSHELRLNARRQLGLCALGIRENFFFILSAFTVLVMIISTRAR